MSKSIWLLSTIAYDDIGTYVNVDKIERFALESAEDGYWWVAYLTGLDGGIPISPEFDDDPNGDDYPIFDTRHTAHAWMKKLLRRIGSIEDNNEH